MYIYNNARPLYILPDDFSHEIEELEGSEFINTYIKILRHNELSQILYVYTTHKKVVVLDN